MRTTRFRFWLWLIALLGVIVPRRLRSDWRQEWEAELRYRERLLAEWDRLDWRNKLGLLRRSASAFWDALVLQPQRWEDEMIQDLRFGFRMLLKNPGFTFVAALTLSLGIGANSAIFSVVNAVLLRSLPYRDPDRLVMVNYYRAVMLNDFAVAAEFLEWRDHADSFEQIAACRFETADLTGSGEPERLNAGLVSAELFATLGVAPALGRSFTQGEDTQGGAQAVILSDELWRRRFGGDSQVIGRTLTLGGQSRTVVGIMPPGFRFLDDAELWLPLALNVNQQLNRQGGMVRVKVIARLKPGLSVEAARADLSVILERQRQAFPHVYRIYGDVQVRVIGLKESLVGDVRLALLALFGAVLFVLLIACANVANLLLARSAARQKEMAIRAAIGAGRFRLVRQSLTETLLLSLVGGLAGLLLAKWGVKLLVAFSPDWIARIEESHVDGRVLGFTCVVALLTCLLAGLFPALQASRTNVNETLKAQSARSSRSGRRRAMPVLMIAELALSLVLLVGAGLMIKSFNQARTIEPNQPVNPVVALEERLSNSRAVAGRRFQMLLFGVFAGLALVIAAVGIYGVISYAVNQRAQEIGIRMALGARASDVLRMVIWRGMSLTLIGVGVGVAAALALTRVMENLLFNVSATDPMTFALIALLLIGVAFIASYIPARRATKVGQCDASPKIARLISSANDFSNGEP